AGGGPTAEVCVMPHEFVSGVFGGNRPAWHRLGRVVPDLLTTEEALRESGVGSVGARPEPVYIRLADDFRVAPEYVAVVRNDTDEVLGVHGDGYVIENFCDAFHALGFVDQRVWETMVLLRQGRIAAGVLRLPDLDKILPDGSHTAAYVAAYTSHDGSYALTYKDTSVRIECANKLRAADADRSGRCLTIRHTASKEERKREAAHIITYAQERADYHERQAIRLLQKRVSDQEFSELLDDLLPLSTTSPRSATIAQNKRAKIRTIYRDAPDQQNIRGTAWGVANAFAAFADHEATYANTTRASADENRFVRTVLKEDTIADRAVRVLAQL